ncbi:MAG: hypothetical protein WKG01_29030 [Kofleriaceae bacterium]
MLTLVGAHTATADPMAEPTRAPVAVRATAVQPTYDIGFRVGGYGFRREGDTRPGAGWTECRMSGIGAFASRTVVGPVFVEADSMRTRRRVRRRTAICRSTG